MATTELQVSPEPPKKAAVIDDAFDDVTLKEITFKSFQEFYEIVNDNGQFDAVLAKLTIEKPNLEDWDDQSEEYLAFLRRLWKSRDNKDLLQLFKTGQLFSTKLEKLEDLNRVCKNLQAQNIEVKTFPSVIEDLAVFEQEEFVYIFIDYNLGVQEGPEAVAHAKNVAKSIYEKCPKDKQRPVTVLMSAKQVTDGDKQKFQHDAEMLEGVFRFSSKNDLIDENNVTLLIRAYKEEWQSNHSLQDYIQSLIDAAKEAQKKFEEDVKVLRVEDYEFIHNSVLQNQQQPLGDYLAWLYGTHWINLLLKNNILRDKQKVIDNVITKKPPLHHSPPSEKIAEMFMNALFEQNLDEIDRHPWSKSQTETNNIEKQKATLVTEAPVKKEIGTSNEENRSSENDTSAKQSSQENAKEIQDDENIHLPFLHLGDLFTKRDHKHVFMILNPQCDLERPNASMKNQSIFIVPGALIPIDEPLDKTAVRTDFFVFQTTNYRIKWNLKNVESIPFGKFDQWRTSNGLDRNCRLRLPFALDIQQRFTSNMSRVGLPVSPPLPKHIELKVQYRDLENNVSTLIEGKDYAFFPIATSKQIRLTLKFALDFKGAIVDVHKKLEEAKNSGTIDVKHNKVIAKIKKFIDEFDDWYFKDQTLNFPEKVKPLVNDVVSLGADLDTYVVQMPFLINLHTKKQQAVIIEQSQEEATNNDVKELSIAEPKPKEEDRD